MSRRQKLLDFFPGNCFQDELPLKPFGVEYIQGLAWNPRKKMPEDFFCRYVQPAKGILTISQEYDIAGKH